MKTVEIAILETTAEKLDRLIAAENKFFNGEVWNRATFVDHLVNEYLRSLSEN